MSETPQAATSTPESQAQTRIGRRFAELRRAGELGLVAYITAGDPSLAATREIVLAAADAGADVIELGVPFSDPVADGPVIQRASERALRAGTTLAAVIDLVADLRRSTEVPLVLFSYFYPILQIGLGDFALRTAQVGADGVLATDLTPEEATEYRQVLRAAGLDTIFLAAPTTPDERLARIAAVSSGFLYLISRTGVTGQRDQLPEDLTALVSRVRRSTALPLAVGFGLSQPEHLRALVGKVEAAVVGSALVSEIERAESGAAAAQAVAARIRSLKSGSHGR
ncbi:MAG: tryptophan synthase subunit alpha [Acidobacteriota bacterium]|nr:tryptophan synthase subunit alpha [Acidobacteriota bacterium]